MENLITTNSQNIVPQNVTANPFFDSMEKAYKIAQIIASADIIPQHYREKPANVFIAVQTAWRMNIDPMLVMQNTYVVGGKLVNNTAFSISLANTSGLLKSGIKYKVNGKDEQLLVTAYAALKTGEEISFTVSMKQAIAENWVKNPKYKTLPELMLMYRAATFLIRTHVPEVLNNMHTVEELEDVTLSRASVQASKIEIPIERIEVQEKKSNLANQLVNLCKEHSINSREFAKFYQIDSEKPETVQNGITNFDILKTKFMEKSHESV